MKNILLIVLAALLITSCTKIIDLDLNSSDPKIVIEAILLEGTSNFDVIISKTGDYFNGGTPSFVSGAVVTLFNGTVTQTLNDMGNGVYSLPSYTATENTTYTLNVTESGNTYESISTIPQRVILDTIVYQYQTASAFSDSGYTASLFFNDPPNIANYYRGVINVNGIDTKGVDDLYIFDDQLLDGNLITIPVFGEVYNAGDILSIDLYSINKDNYDFYSTLEDIVNGNGAAPANPDNNWNNGALGNFTTAVGSNFTGIVQ